MCSFVFACFLLDGCQVVLLEQLRSSGESSCGSYTVSRGRVTVTVTLRTLFEPSELHSASPIMVWSSQMTIFVHEEVLQHRNGAKVTKFRAMT